MAFIIVGAASSIGIAWSSAAFAPIVPASGMASPLRDAGFDKEWEPGTPATIVARGPGLVVISQSFVSSTESATRWELLRHRYGWPFRLLYADHVARHTGHAQGAVTRSERFASGWRSGILLNREPSTSLASWAQWRRLPVCPNAMFFPATLLSGLLAWCLWRTPRWTRRWYWIIRGRCSRCGYSRSHNLLICPECGIALTCSPDHDPGL